LVRTYKPKNRICRNSHLTEAQVIGLMSDYFLGLEIKGAADRHSVSEPTAFRLLAKVQKRLLDDSQLFRLLLGSETYGARSIAAYEPLVEFITKQQNARQKRMALNRFVKCCEECSAEVFGNTRTIAALYRISAPERARSLAQSPPDAEHYWRQRWCDQCPNPLKEAIPLWLPTAIAWRKSWLERFDRHGPAVVINCRVHELSARLKEYEKASELQPVLNDPDDQLRRNMFILVGLMDQAHHHLVSSPL